MLADFIQVTHATIQQLLRRVQALEDAQANHGGTSLTAHPTDEDEIQGMCDDEAIFAGLHDEEYDG